MISDHFNIALRLDPLSSISDADFAQGLRIGCYPLDTVPGLTALNEVMIPRVDCPLVYSHFE